ncbi:MAG: tail fiber assembly protein [Pantoea sp.]|uniref:tail fiber assembly protein n=1 Tax=Pantoea septica TaxID=472695 RepID=UPI000E88C02A|nr:tail fiber assembly protein [Pantoea septica]MBU5376624.1 tail fiber assembly protein [Pantoea septica]MDU5836590.1 tail fiber assembly protein [Pantoea sp.]MDU6439818.1 tail fiber assembly protein [Pantoea sp.]HAT24106.1 hypothetical protein [Pantoea septica]
MNTETQNLPASAGENTAFLLRYFVSLNNENYINAMFVAFSQKDAERYISQRYEELTQDKFESIGPDCLLINGEVIKGPPMKPVFDIEARQAILSSRLRNVSEKIQTLSDAIELGMALDGDTEILRAWKKYRVQLSQLDASIPLAEWPAVPTNGETA